MKCIALLLPLAAMALTSAATAQPITNERRSAEAVFQSGLQSIKKGDYETARGEFEYVYAHEPKPEVLWNLALAEEKSNRLVEALAHFRAYFTDATVPAAKRERAKKHIEEMYARTGHLTIRATTGASLAIDGKPLNGDASHPIDVIAGKHVLESKLGERARKVEIDATAGATVEADVRLDEAVAPPPTTAPTALPPPPTAQDLVLPPPRTAPEEGFWTARNTVAVLLGVGTVAAATVWIGFAVGASSQQSKVDGLSSSSHSCVGSTASNCLAFQDAVDAQRSDSRIATGALVATGVFAVGLGATLLFWPRSSAKTDRAWIAPAFAPGQAGFQLGGRF